MGGWLWYEYWTCPRCGYLVAVKDVLGDWPLCGCADYGPRMYLRVICDSYRLAVVSERWW